MESPDAFQWSTRRRAAHINSVNTMKSTPCSGIPMEGVERYCWISSRQLLVIPWNLASSVVCICCHKTGLQIGAPSRTRIPPTACF